MSKLFFALCLIVPLIESGSLQTAPPESLKTILLPALNKLSRSPRDPLAPGGHSTVDKKTVETLQAWTLLQSIGVHQASIVSNTDAKLFLKGFHNTVKSNWALSAGTEENAFEPRRILTFLDEQTQQPLMRIYESRGDVAGSLVEFYFSNVSFTGKMNFNGGLGLQGDIASQGTARILGSGSFGADLTVGGYTFLKGNVEVSLNETIGGTLSVGSDLSCVGALHVLKNTTLDGDLLVVGSTQLGDTTILQPKNSEASLIRFNQLNGSEKARIGTTEILDEDGLFVSVDSGATKNLYVTQEGSLELNSPQTLDLIMNGNTNRAVRSSWALSAGTALDNGGSTRRTFTLSDLINARNIVRIYEAKNDIIGNLAEVSCDNVSLLGNGLLSINGPVSISGIQGAATVTIANNDLQLTNGNIFAVQGTFSGNVGIGGAPSDTYKLIVVNDSHFSGNTLTDGIVNSLGGFNLTSADSFLSVNDIPLLQTPGTDNLFLGLNAGSFYISGSGNTVCGTSAAKTIDFGSDNVVIGKNALSNIYDGNYNTILGTNAGSAYKDTESNNICIGHDTQGTEGDTDSIHIGNGIQQTFIDGIQGTNIGLSATLVGINATDQLGTHATLFSVDGSLAVAHTINAAGAVQFSSIALPSGTEQLYATGSPTQTTRIVYGFWDDAQQKLINNTEGLEISRTVTPGQYSVTITPNFSAIPTISITPSNQDSIAYVSNPGIDGFTIQYRTYTPVTWGTPIETSSGGAFADTYGSFYITVIGKH
ncbi:MAG: Outer membrane protein [candidate division TM6 bacterium GW2011_GWE2_42_60]|nr:MAG: Outer membrane protein [candidate division TM6 bacterium GW2011_GWE2_42_60]